MVIHYNDGVYKSEGYSAANLRIIENANNFRFSGGVSALGEAYYEAIRLSLNSFKKTAIIHFSVSDINDSAFASMDFNDLSSFAKNNAISLNQVYLGINKNNYFLDLISKNTYGYTINGDSSINYLEAIGNIKNINFGKYYIYYNSFRNLRESGQYRAMKVRVQYRDMFGEEESGYIVP